MRFHAPVPLSSEHDVSAFASSSAEQNQWLARFARTSQASGTVRVFVVTPENNNQVVAYYGWRMGQIESESAPQRWRAGVGRYPQPVAVLARLAVDQEFERMGLGAGLFVDVLSRFLELEIEIGVRGLLIHCESRASRDFYRHLLPSLEEISIRRTDLAPTLVLMSKDLRASLRAGHPNIASRVPGNLRE